MSYADVGAHHLQGDRILERPAGRQGGVTGEFARVNHPNGAVHRGQGNAYSAQRYLQGMPCRLNMPFVFLYTEKGQEVERQAVNSFCEY